MGDGRLTVKPRMIRDVREVGAIRELRIDLVVEADTSVRRPEDAAVRVRRRCLPDDSGRIGRIPCGPPDGGLSHVEAERRPDVSFLDGVRACRCPVDRGAAVLDAPIRLPRGATAGDVSPRTVTTGKRVTDSRRRRISPRQTRHDWRDTGTRCSPRIGAVPQRQIARRAEIAVGNDQYACSAGHRKTDGARTRGRHAGGVVVRCEDRVGQRIANVEQRVEIAPVREHLGRPCEARRPAEPDGGPASVARVRGLADLAGRPVGRLKQADVACRLQRHRIRLVVVRWRPRRYAGCIDRRVVLARGGPRIGRGHRPRVMQRPRPVVSDDDQGAHERRARGEVTDGPHQVPVSVAGERNRTRLSVVALMGRIVWERNAQSDAVRSRVTAVANRQRERRRSHCSRFVTGRRCSQRSTSNRRRRRPQRRTRRSPPQSRRHTSRLPPAHPPERTLSRQPPSFQSARRVYS